MILTLTGAFAYAGLGDVVQSFPLQANGGRVIAVGGNHLYVVCTLAPDYVIKCELSTGSRLSSFMCRPPERNLGLAYEYGGYLWIANTYTSPVVMRCAEANGSVYSSFAVTQHNLGGGLDCRGDPTKPATLSAVICHASNLITYHATAGSLLGSFGYAGGPYAEPAWDYGNEFIWFPQTTGAGAHVCAHSPAGSLVTSFPAPAAYPQGSAYVGEYLWLLTGRATGQFIYKVHCPAGIDVAPASIGRIKTFFK